MRSDQWQYSSTIQSMNYYNNVVRFQCTRSIPFHIHSIQLRLYYYLFDVHVMLPIPGMCCVNTTKWMDRFKLEQIIVQYSLCPSSSSSSCSSPFHLVLQIDDFCSILLRHRLLFPKTEKHLTHADQVNKEQRAYSNNRFMLPDHHHIKNVVSKIN